MVKRFAPFALFLAGSALAQAQAPAPAPAEGPQRPLSLQEGAALKCSAAFAIAAGPQGKGRVSLDAAQTARSKEFFMRTSAGIMDGARWPRERVAAEIGSIAQGLQRPGELEAAMPPCLLLLDASGL
jgi:hypothetical protein